jgi:uncharacterized membrane protein YcjF (UPF0283 family)
MVKKKTNNKKTEKDFERKFEEFGERMEDWAESFGDDLEKKFCSKTYTHKSRFSVGGIFIGLFILAWGVVWLGNDLAWWSIPFPFWPIIIILIGIAVLLDEMKKMA